MATSDNWTRSFWNLNGGGGGERHGMPIKGTLCFDPGTDLKVTEIKDDTNKPVTCGWRTISYTFVTGSSCTMVQGQIGIKAQPFVIEIKGTSPNQTLTCTIAAIPAPPPTPSSLSSGFKLTWLKELLKKLTIHTAAGDAGSWTAVEGGLR
jgi:hypothetical protein